ncbi:MAG: hypothetical protein ACOCQ4_03320, partial [bacterium]
KKHLVKHFGEPADLSSDKATYKYFVWVINRKYFRNSKRMNDPEYGKKYFTETTCISINKTDFPKAEINNAAFFDFNNYIEGYIKIICRTFIVALVHAGWDKNEAIKEFQSTFGYTEKGFSRAAINMDLKRNSWYFKKLALIEWLY